MGKFLIVDGYPAEGREQLVSVGVRPAWKMFADMLERHNGGHGHEVLYPSDQPDLPSQDELGQFAGVMWTGCSLCIHTPADERVDRQVELSRRAFAAGVPQYGSCWAIQIAAVAAGGRVQANPRGREVSVARKIRLHEAGLSHPMFAGKPAVFDAFISHLDEVIDPPEGSQVLGGNDFTAIQAMTVRYLKGDFWATQYHPEFSLVDMGRLILARQQALISEGFFPDVPSLEVFARAMEALGLEPHRKDLRFLLSLDEDILDDRIRCLEFTNWMRAIGP
ncbi:MAG: type 1 glutamine amidotransferase [Vulcanimicrobiota bacterium]